MAITDADSCYTTNQPDIVKHALYCYKNYPTVVNEIKPEKNIYDLNLENYAKIDNTLTACQLAIGRSSNLAQIALTYTYNFEDEKYVNDACILAVLAQVAIDNAKRKFDVDLSKEINRLNDDLNIKENGLPDFWLITKKDKRKSRTDEQRKQRQKENKEKIKKNLNHELKCPMNYLYNLKLNYERSKYSTIPIADFFNKIEIIKDRRKCKKVEDLIEKYSLKLTELYKDYYSCDDDDYDSYLLAREDFEDLINDIRSTYISKNYIGLMSWLINRAFRIGAGAKSKAETMNSNIEKNKSLLLKVLYSVNKDAFLACFTSKNVDND